MKQEAQLEKVFYRLDLTPAEYTMLLNTVRSTKKEYLIKTLEKAKKVQRTETKAKAVAQAREARTRATDKKIEDAIHLLMMQGQELTVYAIAKEAKVSYNTVRTRSELIRKYRPRERNGDDE
jgi:hypothetical protein